MKDHGACTLILRFLVVYCRSHIALWWMHMQKWVGSRRRMKCLMRCRLKASNRVKPVFLLRNNFALIAPLHALHVPFTTSGLLTCSARSLQIFLSSEMEKLIKGWCAYCAGNIGYSILLSAYARVGQIDMVERLANEINSRENGKSDVLLFNTLLKVYCNACYMDGVMATLRKMDTEGCTPDRSTFNILIGYFAKEDLYDLALTTLQDMELRGHCANEVS